MTFDPELLARLSATLPDGTAPIPSQSITSPEDQYEDDVEKLDYGYIGKCSDVAELEKLLKLLRSGKEGHWPELEKFTEERLWTVAPELRIPYNEEPKGDEKEQLLNELKEWSQSKQADTVIEQTIQPEAIIQKKEQRIKGHDFRGWDKFDVDEALAKIDQDEEKEESLPVPIPMLPTSTIQQLTALRLRLPNNEVQKMVHLETQKFKEHLATSDFEDAYLCMQKSLVLEERPGGYLNLALCCLKMKQYDETLNNCNQALEKFPDMKVDLKGKAFLRRGVAYVCLEKKQDAIHDLENALKIFESDKEVQKWLDQARELGNTTTVKKSETKKSKTRINIQTKDDDEESEISSDDEDKPSFTIMKKKTKSTPSLNTKASSKIVVLK